MHGTWITARRRRSGCSKALVVRDDTISLGTWWSAEPPPTSSSRRRSVSPTASGRCSSANPHCSICARAAALRRAAAEQLSHLLLDDRRGPLAAGRRRAVRAARNAAIDDGARLAAPAFLVACRLGDEPGAVAVLREHPGVVGSMHADDHRAVSDAAWSGDARAVALMLALASIRQRPATMRERRCTVRHGLARRRRCVRSCTRARARAGGGPRCTLRSDAARMVLSRIAEWKWSNDHAGVAELLLGAGARPGPDTRDASPAVSAVLARWSRGR